MEKEIYLGVYPIERAWASRHSNSWGEGFSRIRGRLRPSMMPLLSRGFDVPEKMALDQSQFRRSTVASCRLNALVVRRFTLDGLDGEAIGEALLLVLEKFIEIVGLGEEVPGPPASPHGEDRSGIRAGRLVKRISVKGFLGQFDYQLDFTDLPRISIVHGPNGIGKTTLFRLLDAIHNRRPDVVHITPFTSFRVDYGDGEAIEVNKAKGIISATIRDAAGNLMELDEQEEMNEEEKKALVKLRSFEPYISFVQMPGSTTYSVVSRMGPTNVPEVLVETGIMPLFQRSRPGDRGISSDNRPLPIDDISVRLVDTERLRLRSIVNNPLWHRPTDRKGAPIGQGLAELGAILDLHEDIGNEHEPMEMFDVVTCSRHLVGLVSYYDYVDFERPLSDGHQANYEVLESALRALEEGRHDDAARLIGSFNLSYSPYTDGYAKEWSKERDSLTPDGLSKFVSVSLNEMKAYLRLRMLVETVNSMLLYKRMEVHDDDVVFVSEATGKYLEFESLSSGEKNVLMIFYHLIIGQEVLERERFKGAVFIIDEPEISLHVLWQQSIVRNIINVTAGTNSQVIILTHSPQIVHNRSDLLVEVDRRKSGRVD